MKQIREVLSNEYEGKEVTVRGWVYRHRASSKLVFITLRDSTEIIQCVIKNDNQENFDKATNLYIESSLILKGILKKDDRAPTGYELQVNDVNVVHKGEPYPITKDQSIEFLADNRHLWLRSRKMIAILKIRSTVFEALDEYFKMKGFYEYHSPIFQAVQCEGGSELFTVDYFDKKDVFLAQTWQLYAEPAIFALEKIYTIAPSFRAEKSKTSRHLTEYWHAEMEVAWAEFDDIINYGEEMLKHVVNKVLEKNMRELNLLERDVEKLIPIEWGKDLRTIEEEKLTSLYDRPVICTHYPKKVKAFYMMEDSENPDVVLGCDFLAPEGNGEIIGGSQREHNIEEIKKRLIEQGEKPEEYEFYLDTRRYGSVPHGGFGLGVDRLVRWICGLETIKDAIPFPRTMERYKP